jgi:hypothetical protein
MPPEFQSYLAWCLLLDFFSLFDGLHNLVQRLVLVQVFRSNSCVNMCEILCV